MAFPVPSGLNLQGPMVPSTPSDAPGARIDTGTKIVRANALRTLGEADAIVKQAREQAAKIVEESREAYEAERRRGYQDGMEAARLEQAAGLIGQVFQRVEFLGQVEGTIVELVLQALRKIINGFDERERVLMTVRSLLEVARSQRQLTLRIHPDHVAAVKAQASELLAGYSGIDCLDVVGDARLQAGACLLESEVGMVEASTETQFAALRLALEKTLGHHDPSVPE